MNENIIFGLVLFILFLIFILAILSCFICLFICLFRKIFKTVYKKYRYGPILFIEHIRFGLQYSIQKIEEGYLFFTEQIIIKTTTFPDTELRNAIISSICEESLNCGYISTTTFDRCNRIIKIFHFGMLVAKITTHKRYYKSSTGVIRMKRLNDVKSCYV